MKQLILTAFVLLSMLCTQAQETGGEATGLRAGGKIYVVLAVALTILTGLILYLVRLDRKISRLERKGE